MEKMGKMGKNGKNGKTPVFDKREATAVNMAFLAADIFEGRFMDMMDELKRAGVVISFALKHDFNTAIAAARRLRHWAEATGDEFADAYGDAGDRAFAPEEKTEDGR